MKLTLNKALFALGISVLTTSALADDQSMNWTNTDMNQMPMTSQHFVWEAGMANLKEIRMSELALDKSQNSDVISFAKHMIRDHSKANEKLMAIAEKEGLNFPDTNTFSAWNTNWNDHAYGNTNSNWGSNSNAMSTTSSAGGHENYKGAELLELGNQSGTNWDYMAVQSLEMLSGPAFDQAYVSKMTKDHIKCINKFQNAAVTLQDPTLKKYAKKTLPTLREHYRMVQDLQTKVGGDYSDMNETNSVYPNNQPRSGSGL